MTVSIISNVEQCSRVNVFYQDVSSGCCGFPLYRIFRIVILTLIVSIILWSILLAWFGFNNWQQSNYDIKTNTAGPLRVILRDEWNAMPPKNNLRPIGLPSIRVIIAHTATDNCSTQISCTQEVQLIQTFHIESRGFDDIAYNFLVGGDGAVYVGRGWDTQGAHTKGYNVKSICIAFIGTFNEVIPPKRQLNVAQKMIEEGVKLNKLTKDYALYGHRQLTNTQSPGSALFEQIQHWNHWTELGLHPINN